MSKYIKEACVENLSQVVQAKKRGADRIELCDRLDLDGTTPSRQLIVSAKETGIPVRVMIRPRGGNFVYTEEELIQMIVSIEFCKKAEVEGVVFGILKNDNRLDYQQIGKLAGIASPLKVVVHKAIDDTPDPVEAVKNLLLIENILAVLTSGGKPTAFEGQESLREMVKLMGDRMEIVAAGKITDDNIEEVHKQIGAKAYHGKKIVGNLSKINKML